MIMGFNTVALLQARRAESDGRGFSRWHPNG